MWVPCGRALEQLSNYAWEQEPASRIELRRRHTVLRRRDSTADGALPQVYFMSHIAEVEVVGQCVEYYVVHSVS